MNVTLPPARADMVDSGGKATREFYSFFRQIAAGVDVASGIELTDIRTRLSKVEGEMGDGSGGNIQGSASIETQGLLPGYVYITLQGDTYTPGNTQYYGSDGAGARGWFNVSGALASTADVTLAVGTDGVTTLGLSDLADSGTGTLQAITRDAKGRITGTRDATITGTAGRITVANGNAAAGVPTIDLATVADGGAGTLQKTAFDAYGRKTDTSAATTSDLPEGTRLYYTDARADARIDAFKATFASLPNASNDAGAAALGVAVDAMYRNGSTLCVRIA